MDAAFFVGLVVLVVLLLAGPNKIDSPDPDVKTEEVSEVIRD